MPIWLIVIVIYYGISTLFGIAFLIANWGYLYTFDLFPRNFREERKEGHRMTKFGSILVPCLIFLICPIIYIVYFIQYILYEH